MNNVQVVRRDADHPLTVPESEAVAALVSAAAAHDSGRALSEQFTLSVRAGATSGVTHLLADAADGALAGYAQVREGSADEPPSAELVVAPRSRRAGVGTALLAALPPGARVWSHLPGAVGEGAAAFASASGLQPVRSLHVMGRSLVDGPPWPPAGVPDEFVVRPFEPGRDEHAWVEVNAAAFAHHPEQGSLTRADLDQRMGQPWFDPAGFILVCPREATDQIAAFHWTKVDPPDGTVGEVYVVGVAPDRQGSGLGRAVTVLGLDHLAGRGLADVVLYVDEENTAAVHTYTRLGFTDREVHRQFAREPRP
ncbi:MAG: mycothiol synthase [Humibacillus sp.]|nr:mycothiol synthase [Humibacillus sp.]MDN5779187.1 mycothiol synthase [Humibacillus sp.]